MGAEVFLCAHLFGPGARWIRGGGLVVEHGAIRRVLVDRGSVRRAAGRATRVHDLGDAWVAPGLVDAHAHLELTFLEGALPRGLAFGEWVRAVVARRRAASKAELEAAVVDGARRLLQTGTTTVGDIDSAGGSVRALARTPLRHVVFREVLDAYDPARTDAAAASVSRPLARRAPRSPLSLRREGLSPHAPFTVSPALLGVLGALARRRRLAVQVHWSETRAEVDWLERGIGPLAPLLGPSPLRRGLALLGAAGLLSSRTALVHGNHPARGEPAVLARSGATLVHCPGCHAWFGRDAFPWARYRKAGVRVALGTDSLASNDALDLRAEMARFASEHPSAAPLTIWRMATVDAAAALALDGEVGELAPGFAADFVEFEPDGVQPSVEHLVHGLPRVRRVWIGGRAVRLPRA